MYRLNLTFIPRSASFARPNPPVDRGVVNALRAAMATTTLVPKSVGALDGGGLVAALNYQIEGEGSSAEHRALMEEVRLAAERAGFQLLAVSVSRIISRAVEGAITGAAAGLIGGSKTDSPWVALIASGFGGVVGHIVGGTVENELPLLVGVQDAYGRWWLQAFPESNSGLQPSFG